MLKDFYNAIQTRLGSISGEDLVPILKQNGMWNEQWAYEKENNPLSFPCCFVEFVSIPWEQMSNKVQQASAIIKLHIGSRTLNEKGLDHLTLLEVINYAMTGFQGTNFGTWTRIATEVDHNHDALIAHSMTYRVRVQDNTAIRPLLRVDGDLLVIERYILPEE